MTINYTEELKRLDAYVPSESGDYWSPEAGQHKIKALGELEDAPPFDDDDDKKPRARLQIKVNDKELIWGMSVGKTGSSTYGQLVRFATQSGTLKDKEFTVVVIGSGRDKRFTIVI